MKVLFAVNNDNISEAIIKKYQKEYKEIISYKNVYYFNAILKELQNDKTYDRVVISEDLEPFANNNYDTIDKFLFEKLDRISDEATKASGEDIEVILICSDRRNKSDEMLTKIFGIGIYNALIGDERNIDNLCRLMYHPRTKKDAKMAYKIEGNSVLYQAENENSVSESEVQNILTHYKRLGKNEDKYVDSFNNIVAQYTDAQLRIIIKYLPLHVKAVLEEQSPKYQELSTFSVRHEMKQEPYKPRNLKSLKNEEKIKVKMLENEKDKITKNIVIPSALKNKGNIIETKKEDKQFEDLIEKTVEMNDELPKRGRGRPRKIKIEDEVEQEKPKRGRGRPKKEETIIEDNEEFDLFNMELEDETNISNEIVQDEFDLFNMGEDSKKQIEDQSDDIDLFNMDMQEEEESSNNDTDLFDYESEEEEDIDLFNINDENEQEESVDVNNYNDFDEQENIVSNEFNNFNEEKRYIEPTVQITKNLNTLITGKKKIVAFVGTTKNGTSFVVNNLALTLSSMDISTAVLDVTQSKNAYYIFTNNEERLRRIAEKSISNLEKGIAEGINVNRNLTIYTEIPNHDNKYENIETMLATLMEKHDVVLIDTDFNTNIEFFEKSQEIYLVQSMDVLTIQPLTAFLRDLKTKGVLRPEKIKIVINKEIKVKTLTDKILIGGMSSYNDPAMTLMTELFNKDNVKYCKIPYEAQNYVKYLDSLVNCDISLRGYTKQLLMALKELAEMVYPLLNKSKYDNTKNKKKRMEFSEETSNTLNKMRRNY